MTKLRRRLAQEERKPRLAELTDWPTALRELVEEDEEGRGVGRPGTGSSSPAPHARGRTPYPLTRLTGAPPAAAERARAASNAMSFSISFRISPSTERNFVRCSFARGQMRS